MIRLFNRYWRLPAAVSLILEASWLALSPLIATELRFLGHSSEASRLADAMVGRHSLAFCAVGLLTLYFNGMYDMEERRGQRQLMVQLLRTLTSFVFAISAVYFLIPSFEPGRLVFVLALAIAGLGLGVWRMALASLLRSERFAERLLIVGTGPTAIELAREILARRHLGIRLVGFLSDDPALQGVSLINPRVIGTTHVSHELALAHRVSRVVVAQRDYRGRIDMDALLACKTSGIRVQECSSYYEQLVGKILLDGLRKSWLIFSDGFVVSRGRRAIKRAVDLAAAIAGLILAAPVMAVTAIAIRLDSKGPILFRQERVGLGGRPFQVWKFRSMHTGAEAPGEALWASANDPRVTRVGRLLRKSRLDELPQLWNVLRGDMSLVGPRPERQPFVRQLIELSPLYEQRFVVRPGLTGWAQIMAPYASSFEDSIEKLKLDLYYIKNLSLFLDLSILLSTIRTVLFGRGAR